MPGCKVGDMAIIIKADEGFEDMIGIVVTLAESRLCGMLRKPGFRFSEPIAFRLTRDISNGGVIYPAGTAIGCDGTSDDHLQPIRAPGLNTETDREQELVT